MPSSRNHQQTYPQFVFLLLDSTWVLGTTELLSSDLSKNHGIHKILASSASGNHRLPSSWRRSQTENQIPMKILSKWGCLHEGPKSAITVSGLIHLALPLTHFLLFDAYLMLWWELSHSHTSCFAALGFPSSNLEPYTSLKWEHLIWRKGEISVSKENRSREIRAEFAIQRPEFQLILNLDLKFLFWVYVSSYK